MYRLLIIDDEPYIVNWVYELFGQHQELELDIYKAYSASEALGLLSRAKIDIVLTDIKMPGMNGLELLSEIQQSWPLCKVIFLTAYDEFEYAHIANKGGVTYLLKTENDDEIIKAIEKAVNEIDNIIKQEEIIRNAKMQMDKTLPIMQREYLRERLKGGDDSPITQNQLDELDINLDAGDDLLLLIGRIDDWYLTKQVNDRSRQSAIIQTIAQSFFSPVLQYTSLQLDNSILVWLIQPQKNAGDRIDASAGWDKTIVYVKGTLDSIQDQCKKSLGISSSFVMDSKPCPWQALAQGFSSLMMMMSYRGANSGGMILTKVREPDDNNGQQEQYEFYLRQIASWMDKLNILEAYLENGQREEFYGLFNEIKERLAPIIKTHSNLGIEVYFSISLRFLTYINRYEYLLEKLTIHSELIRLMNISATIPYDEAFENFDKIADMIFLYQKDDSEKKDNILVFKLHDYIRSNLDKDVSLVKLAELVYLNPAYLSRIYKNITGFNLSAYINNTRMHKAKSMLKERNAKVYEIASAVGFESVAYFIRSFKKSTGMTPQEYREKYEASN